MMSHDLLVQMPICPRTWEKPLEMKEKKSAFGQVHCSKNLMPLRTITKTGKSRPSPMKTKNSVTF